MTPQYNDLDDYVIFNDTSEQVKCSEEQNRKYTLT